MSIIAKALKKAQEERNKEHQKDVIMPANTSFSTNGKSENIPLKKKVDKRVIMVCIIAGGMLIAAGSAFFMKTGIPGEAVPEKKIAPGTAQVVTIPGEPFEADFPVLSGIMYSVSNPQAVINGVMVSKGEIVDGFTVLEVLQNKVRMTSGGGKEFELKLR